MANLTAEQFLAQVKMVADANDITMEVLEFVVPSGMRCSWFNNDDEDEADAIWADTSSLVSQ